MVSGIGVDEDRCFYQRLREKYLEYGITLEDLFNYFEMGRRVDREIKMRIERLVRERGLSTVLLDFWKWMDLAERYNSDELKFLKDS